MFGQFNVQSSYEVGKDDSLTYKAPNNIGSIKEVVWWVSGTLGTSVVGHIEQQPAAFNRTFDFSNNPISVATFNSSHNELNFRFGDAASNLELVQIDIHYIDAAGDNRQFHKEEWVTVNTITPPTISGPSDIKKCCTDPVIYTASGYQTANVFAWTVTGGTVLSGNGTNTVTVQPSIDDPISVSCNVSRTQSIPAYNYSNSKSTTRSQVVTPPIEGPKYPCLGDVNEFIINLDDFCGAIDHIVWDIPNGFEDVTNGSLTNGVILQPIPAALYQTLRITAQLVMANGCVATVSSHYVTIFDYGNPPTPQGYIAVTTDPDPITDPCDDYALFFNFVRTDGFQNGLTTVTPNHFIGVPHHIKGNTTVDVRVCYYNPCSQVQVCTTFVVDLPAPCPEPRIGNNPTTLESLTFEEVVNLADVKQEESTSETLKIYPNPTSGRLQIEYLQELPSIIRILDMSGKVAFETIAQQRNQTIDLTALPSGVYVVEIIGKERTEKQLIVSQ
jgi:hypothetical protein